MFTKITTATRCETLCSTCLSMIDADGISRQVPEWGEDVITSDMVWTRESAPEATRCTWCGPESRWLSERLIAQCTIRQRAQLKARILARVKRSETQLGESHPSTLRLYRILGRFNLES